MALHQEGENVFEDNGVHVTYTGVGKVNATYNLMKALERRKVEGDPVTVVMNFGTAGSHKLPKASLVACDEFWQRDMDATAFGHKLGVTPMCDHPTIITHDRVITHLKHASCGSGDNFAEEASRLPCDVLDMEAYALAKVCHMEGIKFVSVKYVSDGAEEGGADDWKENAHKASQMYFDTYQKVMKENN